MYTFHKSERLCSKKLIAQLFEKGNRGFSRFPFRFSWVFSSLEEPVPVQVLFIVPKRNHPKANRRNTIKRQMRELYRLSKHTLFESLGNRQIALSIFYTGSGTQSYSYRELQQIFDQGVKQLCHELEKNY